MKRIILSIAVAAALVSCVKENTFAPELQNEGNLTIKAVAAGTKTTLDKANVLWENTDKIKVVYGENMKDFSAANVNGANADFVGTIAAGELDAKCHPYAVYPETAVTVDPGTGNIVIAHELLAEQTGVVGSGMNISSAILDEEAMAEGTATAQFSNALTLLQVVVPEGVESVAFTADYGLVGKATFTVDEKDSQGAATGDYDDYGNPIYETIAATGKLTTSGGTDYKKTVTLKDGDALEAGTYSVLVYPTQAGSTPLTLTMIGTDGTEYTSTVNVKLLAGEYRTVDLTKIFGVVAKAEYVVLPAGGTVEIPVTAVGEFAVSIPADAQSWLSYALPVKSFHSETVVFTVEENTSGTDREATVTISSNGKEKSFKISQKNIYMGFVEDEEGNTIQWEETFGLYSDAELRTQLTTFTNVFTIALSDDFSKGTYKISNMFQVDSYWHNSQQVTNKGGEYYANYDAENGELTVLKANSASGYTFTGNVVLAYDAVNKTFSAEKIQATLLYGSSYYESGATRYLGNYAAAVKVEEEGGEVGDGFDITSLYGVYNENFTVIPYLLSPETTEISESDNNSYDIKIKFFYTSEDYSTQYDTAYGKVNASGTEITVTYLSGSNFMSKPAPFVLTVSEGTLSGSVGAVTDYQATKKVNLAGTWSIECEYAPYAWNGSPSYSAMSTTMVIENGVSDGEYLITTMFGTPTGDKYKIPAVFADNVLTTSAQSQYPEMTFVYSNGKLTCDMVEVSFQAYYRNIVATK